MKYGPVILSVLLAVVSDDQRASGEGLAENETEALLRQIQQSHIDGNVPAGVDFDRLLRRDLGEYFTKASGTPVQADYELLRAQPTQVGVAFPKYYAWVTIRESGKPAEQGVVRVAAIQGERFEITNYVSAAEIRRDPEQLSSLFPEALVEGIKAKASSSK